MRWLWLVVVAGCGADTAETESPGWSWRFVDPATHEELAACPALVDHVSFVVGQVLSNSSGECVGSPSFRSIDSVDASCDEHTIAPLEVTSPGPSCYDDALSVKVIAVAPGYGTYDSTGFPYAPSGHAELNAGRGFYDLTWTIVKPDGVTPADCPYGASVIASEGGAVAECTAGHARSAGLPAGPYALTLDLARPRLIHYGSGTASVTVTVDTVTAVSATIKLTQ